ncbi:alpha/beta fold hydrolase [Halorussus lipolyticus]|uniref:alpha/beta fold hydrolase n=1 Tax=Halorussus lipolyticus TaxID=3034024 RepID=UPI0023E87924|nr:alpha/beta hydrolase [Halorussus sp. DT80]
MATVRTNDIRTYYEEDGTGPPVVFVHGAILDHSQWYPQTAALSDEYRTVAYDVRGHGRTGGSARRRYSVDLLASDLDALVRALDLEKPVVCGLSTGGCIAQVYAAAYPEELSGLVLADTFGTELLDWREWLQRSVLLQAAIPPVRLLGYPRVEKAMVWLQEQVQGEAVSGDYEAIERLRDEGPEMETDEFVKVIRALVAFSEAEIDYSAIAAPTLVLYGEHEPGFVRRHAPRLGARIPNATVREVPDAGHASNLDNPAFFTAALRGFLAEWASRGETSDGEETRSEETNTD